MSQPSLFPDGVKPSDAERGTPRVPPPVPFIPSMIETEDKDARKTKVVISKEVTEWVPVFEGGAAKKYLRFVESFWGFVRKKELHKRYEGYEKAAQLAEEEGF